MIDDEIPKSFASVVGHVCGVIAVGMAALSLFGVWTLLHKVSVPAVVSVAISVALTVLMFRWAGALTGFWDTRGRLAVPKPVYAVLGALFVSFTLVGAGLAFVRPPASVDAGLVTVISLSSGVAMTYLCYLAYRRFK